MPKKWLSVSFCAKRLSVDPACSKPAQKIVEATKSTKRTTKRRREAEVPGVIRRDAHALEDRAEALALREPPADERRDERSDIDPHVEDREARVAPGIGGTVELSDHRADVRLQESGAEDDQPE